MGIERPKTDTDRTYLKNKNIDKDINKKLRKKGAYETNKRNIYNLIFGQINKQLQ